MFGHMQSDAKTQRITGLVKWFDPTKGFGLVASNSGGPDILLHANVLRNFGQSSVADGADVEVRVQYTERGVQAVEIIAIRPPEASSLSDLVGVHDSEASNAPLQPGRVKWFDKGKGFGFANVFGSADDIFLHIEILRRSGLADLQPGEALALRVIDGKRGRMASEVLAWEAASQNEELLDATTSRDYDRKLNTSKANDIQNEELSDDELHEAQVIALGRLLNELDASSIETLAYIREKIGANNSV